MNNIKETLRSVRDVPPDIGSDFKLDSAVIEEFPKGTQILYARSFVTSIWTRTARVATTLDGEMKDYFLECATETGASMAKGEFHSISEFYKLIPALTPRPVAGGKFRDSSIGTYFFLCESVHRSTSLPDPIKFCARIAQLHR